MCSAFVMVARSAACLAVCSAAYLAVCLVVYSVVDLVVYLELCSAVTWEMSAFRSCEKGGKGLGVVKKM